MSHFSLSSTLLLTLVGVDIALPLLCAWGHAAFFRENGALGFLLRLLAVLIAYTAVILWIGRRRVNSQSPARKTAFTFGVATGLIEIGTVALENGSTSFNSNKAAQFIAMLTVFGLWGIAAIGPAWRSRSIAAGLFASVGSAMICMLIAVAGGMLIELVLIPANSTAVATWEEFKRSGWSDPGAFRIANTLDSAFSHLFLAPAVAAILGGLAAVSSRVLFIRPRLPPQARP